MALRQMLADGERRLTGVGRVHAPVPVMSLTMPPAAGSALPRVVKQAFPVAGSQGGLGIPGLARSFGLLVDNPFVGGVACLFG